jgi:hypothetical protein
MLQQVQPQHPFQPDRRTPVARLGVERLNHGAELTPRHHLLHFGQKRRPTGQLAMLLEAGRRQGQLPHLSQLRRSRPSS